MKFDPPLEEGILVRRYKRFLADIKIAASGVVETMHCANTGAMLGCSEPGSHVWFSTSDNTKRKYKHSWELVQTLDGDIVCVNTARVNRFVEEALRERQIDSLVLANDFKREVPIPGEHGRFDFGDASTVIEVKSVTLGYAGRGAFPDAVSERASRHVQALARCAAAGWRAVLVFCVPHSGIEYVTPAEDIDPQYAINLRAAVAQGVEVIALRCVLAPEEVRVVGTLPVEVGACP